ncbi:MAG TPA: [LysW]-aminoadipate kinase [Thermoplasmata archaeon]|nr:[LysW]-aminoadipate kinase [Thermoplasmata archaeon]
MTIVVKIGGAAGNARDAVLDDLAARRDFLVVHGGSERVDRLGEALGRPAQYYTSPSGVVSRRSDPAHLEVLVLALAGAVQTEIVAALLARGVRAIGLSGVDAGLLLARRKEGAREVVDGHVVRLSDDRSGTIERVDAALLGSLTDLGLVPVIGPPAVSEGGEILNVDADRVAAEVAGAVGAEALLLLTNVNGLLRDRSDPASRISRVARDGIEQVLPLAAGRMKKKVLAAQAALRAGVGRVVIAPSQGPNPVDRALAGDGTVFE